MERSALTHRQRRFVQFVNLGRSYAQAAREAGYSPSVANCAGRKIANKPEVKAALENAHQQLAPSVAIPAPAAAPPPEDAEPFLAFLTGDTEASSRKPDTISLAADLNVMNPRFRTLRAKPQDAICRIIFNFHQGDKDEFVRAINDLVERGRYGKV